MTDSYRARLAGGEAPDSLLPEAFAAVREAAWRAIRQRPHDQQVMAGAAVHMGAVVEMQAGEGKTLAITLPAYLNALAGRGVHVMTASSYLGRRDHDSMRPVYEFLGMQAGLIAPGLKPAGRRLAYSADVTYGSDSEYCCDYLRDNLAWTRDERVQRGHGFGIVDEADLIMVDRIFARRQITGPPDGSTARLVVECEHVAQQMRRDKDYLVDEKRRLVSFTRKGANYAADWFGVPDMKAPGNATLGRMVRWALQARELYQEDRDYVIRDGRVLALDPRTGEVNPRSFLSHIQEAIEAREGLQVRAEGPVLAIVRTAGYLDLYDRLAGITATAATDADAYRQLYDLDVVAIPAGTRTRRTRRPDRVYATRDAKLSALAQEAAAQHLTGRPVLITYGSVRDSRQISLLLDTLRVPHVLLDVADHDRERSVIAGCGQESAVTVAAATAGQGMDSALGDGTESGCEPVSGLGGLIVLSAQRQRTERLDLRIANRCGRRGAPGEVRFFVSYEDDTVRWLLGEQMAPYLARLRGEARRAKMVESLITKQQRQGAVSTASLRVRELRFNRILDQQRTMIYDARRAVLECDDLGDQARRWISEMVGKHAAAASATGQDAESLWEELRKLYPVTLTPGGLAADCGCEITALPCQLVAERITADALQAYDHREAELTSPVLREAERRVMLGATDRAWQEHLAYTVGLPESAWHPPDPAASAALRKQMSSRFTALTERIREEAVKALFFAQVERADPGTRDRPAPGTPQDLTGQAREEAMALGCDQAGTGDFLLALLRHNGGTATQALNSLGITRQKVAPLIQSITGQHEPIAPGGTPYTAAAAAALEASLHEARRLGHGSAGPEHILLALTKDRECAAIKILARLGASPRQVRHEVLRLLYATPGPEARTTPPPHAQGRAPE